MRIIMIGFMGVGKTTIGKKLAQRLDLDFVDMDDEIEKREKCNISTMFTKYGEKEFRNLENVLLEELVKKDNLVISTGGGIVTVDRNCSILNKESKVIFLDASSKTISSRVSKETNKRPLLKNSLDIDKTISELLQKRKGKYSEVSDIIIDVNDKNIEEVISQILVYIR